MGINIISSKMSILHGQGLPRGLDSEWLCAHSLSGFQKALVGRVWMASCPLLLHRSQGHHFAIPFGSEYCYSQPNKCLWWTATLLSIPSPSLSDLFLLSWQDENVTNWWNVGNAVNSFNLFNADFVYLLTNLIFFLLIPYVLNAAKQVAVLLKQST